MAPEDGASVAVVLAFVLVGAVDETESVLFVAWVAVALLLANVMEEEGPAELMDGAVAAAVMEAMLRVMPTEEQRFWVKVIVSVVGKGCVSLYLGGIVLGCRSCASSLLSKEGIKGRFTLEIGCATGILHDWKEGAYKGLVGADAFEVGELTAC